MRAFVESLDPIAAPTGLEGAVYAIGNFDGLHRGHRAVIQRAQEMAQRLQKPAAVLTFEPHPADYFAKRPVTFRLTPPREKAQAARALGLDGVVALNFNEALSRLTAAQFIDEILVGRLKASGIVAGYDFHFGARREGAPDFLRVHGGERGLAVDIVARVAADESGGLEAVSSTAIRAALEAGDVARAARLLGRPWRVSAVVAHGRKVGRTLGFPTANLALDPSCRLRHGVYAVRAHVDGATFSGAASFGSRPMFDNGPPLLEVFLIDFTGDLYDRAMDVDFCGFLREEARFDSLEALIAQMHEDVAQTRTILAREK